MNSTAQFTMIAELDLNPIKMKLMDKESGEGWTPEQVDAAEFEYRRFLYLMKLFPHEHTSPLLVVDIFWHYHILDTMKYAADCAQIFGFFLHHSPGTGARGVDDEAAHHRAGTRMQELYEATFGEACIRQKAGNAVAAWCQGTITAKTAWCQGMETAPTAWCQGIETAPTAWCQGMVTAPTAWCQGTITAWPKTIAQNSSFYSVATELAKAA